MSSEATREALQRRHKQLRKALRIECNDALSGKKGAERSQAEAQNTARTAALEAELAKEVELLEAGEPIPGLEEANPEPKSQEPKAEVPLQANGKPMTKAQLKHWKKREQAKADLAKKAETKATVAPTAREIELERIAKQLESDNLAMKEVEADGHCLYRAVADQLLQTGQGTITKDTKSPHLLLRSMCANFMSSRRHEFEPFIDESLGTFESYLERMKTSADWGGQLELRALSQALGAPIVIVDAENGQLTMGEEETGQPLKVTFHRHFLALGEHYNSVQPKTAAST